MVEEFTHFSFNKLSDQWHKDELEMTPLGMPGRLGQ